MQILQTSPFNQISTLSSTSTFSIYQKSTVWMSPLKFTISPIILLNSSKIFILAKPCLLHSIIYIVSKTTHYWTFPWVNILLLYITYVCDLIILTISNFKDPTTILFANQTISLSGHTLKMTITISNWNFMSSRNSLHLRLHIFSSSECFSTNSNSVYDVQWITIRSGSYVSFLSFLFFSSFLFFFSFFVLFYFWQKIRYSILPSHKKDS